VLPVGPPPPGLQPRRPTDTTAADAVEAPLEAPTEIEEATQAEQAADEAPAEGEAEAVEATDSAVTTEPEDAADKK